MAGVLALTSKLEAELPGMLAEHKEIGPPRSLPGRKKRTSRSMRASPKS
jgi:hypothetical protein